MSQSQDEQALRASRDPLAALALADLLEEQGCLPERLDQHRWRARVMVELLPEMVRLSTHTPGTSSYMRIDGVHVDLKRTRHCIRVAVFVCTTPPFKMHRHHKDFLPSAWQLRFLFSKRQPGVDYDACNSITWKMIRDAMWTIADAMHKLWHRKQIYLETGVFP